jgi:hypothetical protein
MRTGQAVPLLRRQKATRSSKKSVEKFAGVTECFANGHQAEPLLSKTATYADTNLDKPLKMDFDVHR